MCCDYVNYVSVSQCVKIAHYVDGCPYNHKKWLRTTRRAGQLLSSIMLVNMSVY